LYPGGKQVHVEKLFNSLYQLKLDVQYENWHDPHLTSDIVHFFGYNDCNKIELLKKKGFRLVYTHIVDGLTNLSNAKKKYHQWKNKLLNHLPDRFNPLFLWKSLPAFDALIYMHESDRETAIRLFNVDPKKTFVIPHAVDSIEWNTNPKPNWNPYLVSIGSIVERKNSIFTALACQRNKIHIKFIGQPHDIQSGYFREFLNCIDNEYTQYLGYLNETEKRNYLQNASGFVLLSKGESGCIAVYEAASMGLPLLLSDLPWAKHYENPRQIYFSSPFSNKKADRSLSNFCKYAQRCIDISI
jgi:glycosyltransferase involved in cell wall biosynthesis